MIPHRMPSNEMFGNQRKDRVTACRKRLRLNRVSRAQFDNQVEELVETAVGALQFSDSLDSAKCESEVHAREGEASTPVDMQEVGIT